MQFKTTVYTNPRKYAEFPDWPSGSTRVLCTFEVEQHKSGKERILRTTEKPFRPGVKCAPKKTTYAQKVFIVDGDDSRTYIMELTSYGSLSVMSSDCQHSHESIHHSEQPERFNQYIQFFKESI